MYLFISLAFCLQGKLPVLSIFCGILKWPLTSYSWAIYITADTFVLSTQRFLPKRSLLWCITIGICFSVSPSSCLFSPLSYLSFANSSKPQIIFIYDNNILQARERNQWFVRRSIKIRMHSPAQLIFQYIYLSRFQVNSWYTEVSKCINSFCSLLLKFLFDMKCFKVTLSVNICTYNPSRYYLKHSRNFIAPTSFL